MIKVSPCWTGPNVHAKYNTDIPSGSFFANWAFKSSSTPYLASFIPAKTKRSLKDTRDSFKTFSIVGPLPFCFLGRCELFSHQNAEETRSSFRYGPSAEYPLKPVLREGNSKFGCICALALAKPLLLPGQGGLSMQVCILFAGILSRRQSGEHQGLRNV